MTDIPRFEEVSLITAYLRFFTPDDTPLTDTCCRIISRRLDGIRSELARLEINRDWRTLKEVKIRLREYFEYSGAYRYGVECGRRFVRALEELGEKNEAAWTRVKQVGYLSVLAGEHRRGREELQTVLSSLQNAGDVDTSGMTLQFYCNRYLGISFQRQELPGNLEKAKSYFDEANRCIDAVPEGSQRRAELQARLWGNYGNLALDAGDPDGALKYYCQSHQFFIELNDLEHIGIANLQIGQATIAVGADVEAARRHLDSAESLFIDLGYVECQGRVDEQRAILYLAEARVAETSELKRRYALIARENAERARRLFKQTDSQKRIGTIEAFLQSLQKEFPQSVTEVAVAKRVP